MRIWGLENIELRGPNQSLEKCLHQIFQNMFNLICGTDRMHIIRKHVAKRGDSERTEPQKTLCWILIILRRVPCPLLSGMVNGLLTTRISFQGK